MEHYEGKFVAREACIKCGGSLPGGAAPQRVLCDRCRNGRGTSSSRAKKREMLFLRQNGQCALCQEKFVDDFGNVADHPRWSRIQLDHRHSDGEVRGLLCGQCNTAMGGLDYFLEAVGLETAEAYARGSAALGRY